MTEFGVRRKIDDVAPLFKVLRDGETDSSVSSSNSFKHMERALVQFFFSHALWSKVNVNLSDSESNELSRFTGLQFVNDSLKRSIQCLKR